MNEFESLAGGPEGFDESGLRGAEWVGSTEICNFEGCSLMDSKELSSYLSETLPASHLEGCPSVTFDPQHPLFVESPETLGFFETGSHAIHIADESRFADAEGVLNTVTHEMGHNVHANLIENNPEVAEKWLEVHQESWTRHAGDGTGFVSEYAKTNVYEDFAESYMSFIRDPEKLQILSPEKYSFMRDYVFAGREYQPTVLASWEKWPSGTMYERAPDGSYTGRSGT